MTTNTPSKNGRQFSFLKRTAIVFLGTFLSQAIPIAATVITARIYEPTEFGEFAKWLGIATVLSLVVSGALEQSLFNVNQGEERRKAVIAVLMTIVLVCTCFSLLVIGYGLLSSRSEISFDLITYILAAMLMQSMNCWQIWACADGEFRSLVVIRISLTLTTVLAQIVLGVISPKSSSLVFGHLVGYGCGTMIAMIMLPISISECRHYFAAFWPNLRRFWSVHSKFVFFSLPSAFINSVASQIPLVMIDNKFGSDACGFYSMSNRVLSVPLGVLGKSILDVFRRDSSKEYQESGDCRKIFLRTFGLLSCLSVIFVIGVIATQELVFDNILGTKWHKSGVIAIWLLPMFALRFAASPLSFVLYIAEKQHIDLIWQVVLILGTFLVFALANDFEGSIKLYALFYGAMYVAYLYLSYRSTRRES